MLIWQATFALIAVRVRTHNSCGDRMRGRFETAVPDDRPQCLMAHWKRKMSQLTKPSEEASSRHSHCGGCYSAER
eukprot:8823426-Pyramimonas_sp.AAC.1